MSRQKARTLDIQVQDFPGVSPKWQKVAAGQLGKPPYNRICQVMGQTALGSGWLVSPGLVLTAAHVVASGAAAKVRFAGQANWIDVTVHVAQGYFAPNGTQRECSPQDVATLTLPAGVGAPISPFAPVPNGMAAAVGFHKGDLVQHAGSYTEVGPFTAHNCDTDEEHSGCPIIRGSSFHAVHVGAFAGSAAYLQGGQAQTKGYLNSAVRIVGSTIAGLKGKE